MESSTLFVNCWITKLGCRAELRQDRTEVPSPPPAELTTRAIVVFAALQALDIITTLLGWRLGAREANLIVARFMHVGPFSGLLIAKLLGFVLIVAVFVRGKARLVRLLNLWFAGIVTWNLVIVWTQWWTIHPR